MGCGVSSEKKAPPPSSAVDHRDPCTKDPLALDDPIAEFERQQALAKARRAGEMDGPRAETGHDGAIAY